MNDADRMVSDWRRMTEAGIAMFFDKAWHALWPYRTPPRWQMDFDFATGDLLFGSSFGRLVLATDLELQDGSYKQRLHPRFEHWLSKNMPRPHHRYVAKVTIRRPRHPSADQ